MLYVTFDGLLQPLGYSQVVKVVAGLAGRGLRYEVLSLERRADLGEPERVGEVRRVLEEAGVAWTCLTYAEGGSGRSALRNLAAALGQALKLVASRRVALLHARAYHAGAVALAVQALTGVPYLFDARCYWIDERLEDGRWFTRPTSLRLARAFERRLYGWARALVTLTELQAQDLLSAGCVRQGVPRATIPTCADYDSFVRIQSPQAWKSCPVRSQLKGRRVVGIVGSLNSSYYSEHAVRLGAAILREDPKAWLLVLTEQQAAFRHLLEAAGVPAERASVVTVPPAAMPGWLSCLDWGLQLLKENRAKRASVPTKLAEFFAAGVRPVHYGCNPEVTDWVRRAGSGLVLESLDEPELARAAHHVAHGARDPRELEWARQRTREHFGLASGLDRYARLLRQAAAV